MSVFIPCMVENTWQYLVKDGEPPKEVIEEAGLSIYSTYCSLVGGIQVNTLLNRSKSIHALASKIDGVQTFIDAGLKAAHLGMIHEGLCEQLAGEGYIVDMNGSKDQIISQFMAAHSRLKTERMRLEQLIAERPEAKNGKQTVTEEEFTSTFRLISKEQGFWVRDNITVLEYGIAVRDLKKSIEANTPKSASNGRRLSK